MTTPARPSGLPGRRARRCAALAASAMREGQRSCAPASTRWRAPICAGLPPRPHTSCTMAQPAAIPNAADEVRLLRSLVERIERGEVVLPAEPHDALVRVLEDAIDLHAVRAARSEPGAVPWEKLKADHERFLPA